MSTSSNDDDRDAKEKAFLEAITKDPNDESSRLVYADWLEETGAVEQAEYLRIENALFKFPRRLGEIQPRLDPLWLRAVSRRFDVWLIGTPNKISAIKLVREISGMGLKEAKDAVEAAPIAVGSDLSFDEARQLERRFIMESGSAMEIRQAQAPFLAAGAYHPPPAPIITPQHRVVLVSYAFPLTDTNQRIALLKAVREVTLFSLAEAKTLIESLPRVLGVDLTLERANEIRARFEGIAEVRIE